MAARLRPAADVVAPRGCSKVAVESLLVFGHACFATTKHPNQGGTPWTNTSESTFTQQVAASPWWMGVASKRVRTSWRPMARRSWNAFARASTSRHGPTTKVRGRVSIVPLDSRAFSKFPSIGYAPSEYRTKPWPQEVLIEGWFPHFAREQDGFRVDGTTDSNTPAPRSLRQRNCGSRHTPLSGDRRIDHLFLTTSIYSRTRVDAGCHNNRIAGRWVIVLLDILFHRRRNKPTFLHAVSHPDLSGRYLNITSTTALYSVRPLRTSTVFRMISPHRFLFSPCAPETAVRWSWLRRKHDVRSRALSSGRCGRK